MLEQAYDVSVTLTLPRSPANLERGNFMIALYALKTAALNPALLPPLSSASSSLLTDPYAHVTPENIVFSSRRPALLPYEDPLVSTASRVMFLLYHILFPKTSQIEKLEVPMGELVEFRDVLPLSILVDVQAGQTLQVYDASLTLVARLSGIRWLMYNHRILSFWVCTGVFWVAEMVSTGLAWLVLAHLLSRKGDDGETIGEGKRRQELGFVTDTSREEEYERMGFPVFKTENEEKPKIKVEEDDSGHESPGQVPLHHAGDADDEGDGEDAGEGSASAAGRSAFGGTSFERGMGGSVRRRSSRGDREHLG
jgi:seipin